MKKENEAIKEITRDIRNLSEHEEKDYHKPVSVATFWNNNYIKYESNSDRKKHYQLKNILIKLHNT